MNTCSKIKQKLRKNYSQNWLKVQNRTSNSSREKFTQKEIKKENQLEEYLKEVGNPTRRIYATKLRLGVHSLRIQTGKFENSGEPIPVAHRKCLACKENYIEDEQHFWCIVKGTTTSESNFTPWHHKMMLTLLTSVIMINLYTYLN